MDGTPTLMTEDEFLTLTENDEMERELIRGDLRERPMTARGCAHTIVSSNTGYHLNGWLRTQPAPRVRLFSGKIRVRLAKEPPTLVGADFAYVAADALPANLRKARYVDGPPLLVIEILSPNDQQEAIADKIEKYLNACDMLVWIIEANFSTVTVYRSDQRAQLFKADQDIDAEPYLPGFRIAVATLFEGLDD